jgi:hypothetical protein
MNRIVLNNGLFLILFAFAASCVTGNKSSAPIEEYRLQGKQAESWITIKKNFTQEAFKPCLAKKRITISCSGCTAVMLRGTLRIDKNGKFQAFDTTYSRCCGSEMPPDLHECLLNFFQNMEFPRELRGISINVDLGRGLKC